MIPAKPPLPTPWNLPFQLAGSQTSNRISESEVGAIEPVTRQKAGRRSMGFALARGGVKEPGSRASARVMVVCGRASDLRLSQVAPESVATAASARRACFISKPSYLRFGGLHGIRRGPVMTPRDVRKRTPHSQARTGEARVSLCNLLTDKDLPQSNDWRDGCTCRFAALL